MTDMLTEFTTSPLWLIAGYVIGRTTQIIEHNRRHHDHR